MVWRERKRQRQTAGWMREVMTSQSSVLSGQSYSQRTFSLTAAGTPAPGLCWAAGVQGWKLGSSLMFPNSGPAEGWGGKLWITWMRKGPLDEAQIFFDPSSSQSDARAFQPGRRITLLKGEHFKSYFSPAPQYRATQMACFCLSEYVCTCLCMCVCAHAHVCVSEGLLWGLLQLQSRQRPWTHSW